MRFKEPLNGGLVTSRDAALLRPGELSAIQNAVYVPKTQALQRSPGRSAGFLSFSPTLNAVTGVTGIRTYQFNTSTQQYIVAQGVDSSTGNNAYWKGVADGGATASKVEEITAGTYLELVSYRNKQFLLNGANANRVWYNAAGTLTSRAHGLQPISSTPATGTVAQTFSATATGFYEYWTTEVLKIADDSGVPYELESTFSGKPVTVNVTSTGNSPIIYRPGVLNSGATHWRLYRSPVKSLATDKKFPLGQRIGEADITTASITDGGTASNSGQLLATGFNTGVSQSYKDWTGVAAIESSTDAGAVGTATSSSAARNIKRQGLYGFAFSGISGNITGIDVEVKAKISNIAAGTLGVSIGRRDTTTGRFLGFAPTVAHPNGLDPNFNFIEKSIQTMTTSLATYTVGGATDSWLTSDFKWNDTDFVANGFQVVLSAYFNTGFSGATIDVDYIKLRIYYGSVVATGDELVPFNAISLTLGGDTVSEGADGPPPTSSTGDIFEDALVVNDVSFPTYIRYSLSGKVESFPSQYYLDLGINRPEAITYIKTLGRVLIVATDRAVWRINYLPVEDDASFQRGRTLDLIDGSHGVVNPMAACLYNTADGRTELAFAAYDGVYSTDGFQVRCLSDDLDYANVITETTPTNPGRVILLNNPTRFELQLFYDNSGNGTTTNNTRRLHFNYHPSHIKPGGTPKISGPTYMRNKYPSNSTAANVRCAWNFIPNSQTSINYPGVCQTLLGYADSTTNDSGVVSYDIADGSGPGIEDIDFYATKIMTRKFFLPESMGSAWTINEVYQYLSQYEGGAFHVTPYVQKNDTTDAAGTAATFSFGGVGYNKVILNLDVEGLRLQLDEDSGTVSHGAFQNAWEFLVLDVSGVGDLENSGVA